MENRQLSEHFSYDELKCPCCGACDMRQRTLQLAESMRRIMGRPLHVNSGYRCLKHNTAVKGKDRSMHLTGGAIDFHCSDTRMAFEMVSAAIEAGFGGIGVDEGLVHCDIRPKDECRLWTY